MKLVYSPRSPFARKVRAAAVELGLEDRLELTRAEVGIGVRNAPYAQDVNPLGKLPVLILDDGTSLVDSAVIVDYLDELGGGGRLIPRGEQRWRVLSEHAIVQGMTDAIVSCRRERSERPRELHWQVWDEDQVSRIHQSLAWFEARPASLDGAFNIAQIGLVCGVEYMDLRLPEESWRPSFPKVAAFVERAGARPSVAMTRPS